VSIAFTCASPTPPKPPDFVAPEGDLCDRATELCCEYISDCGNNHRSLRLQIESLRNTQVALRTQAKQYLLHSELVLDKCWQHRSDGAGDQPYFKSNYLVLSCDKLKCGLPC
jgi:hypothetical protein